MVQKPSGVNRENKHIARSQMKGLYHSYASDIQRNEGRQDRFNEQNRISFERNCLLASLRSGWIAAE